MSSYFSSSVQARKLFQSAVTITTPMPIPEPLFPVSQSVIELLLPPTVEDYVDLCIFRCRLVVF